MRAVNSKGATSQATPLRAAPFADDEVADTDILLANAELEEFMYMNIKRDRITVDALQIARFVCALPGRKNLIWMSGSFPSEIFSNGIKYAGSQWQVVISPDVRAAKKLLDESRVAVYPVDVRGLQADLQLSAAMNFRYSPNMTYFGAGQGVQHATMDVIAESTGGRAFYNTNGLRDAMNAAVLQGSE